MLRSSRSTLELRDFSGGRRVVGIIGPHYCEAVGQIQFLDDIGLTLVNIDGTFVHRGVRPARVHGAEQPTGPRLEQSDRLATGATEVGQVGSPVAAGPVPA